MHVVLLILENRSFDQLFGYRKNVDGIDFDNLRFNTNNKGEKIYQQPNMIFTGYDDTAHDLDATLTMINGDISQCKLEGAPMSGFVLANELNIKDIDNGESSNAIKDEDIMGYFDRGSFPILDLLADNFVVCDRWFASAPTCTLPNRAFGLCGQSDGHINNKCKEGKRLLYECDTIFDRLNQAGKSWKAYYNDVATSLVLSHQLRPQNLSRYYTFEQFDLDVRKNELPDFCFIEPEYGIESSSEKLQGINNGENLIVSILNSLQSNKEVWNNTLFVIYYDECGGFYDHVYPPDAISPGVRTTSATPLLDEYNFSQYGVRVPALLISPLVNAGVDNTLYDHTSVLNFMEEIWGLESLTLRDKTANNFKHLLLSEPRDITLDLNNLVTKNTMYETSFRNRNQADKELFGKFFKRGLMKFISGLSRLYMKIIRLFHF